MTQRFRSRNGRKQSTYTFTYNGTPSNGNGPMLGRYEEMSDTRTPRFRQRQAKGEVVMNFMSRVVQDITAGMNSNIAGTASGIPFSDIGHLEHIACNWTTPSHLSASRFILTPRSEVDRLAAELSTRALSQIGRGSAHNWENIAELGKTVQMLKSPLNAWFKFLTSDRRVKRYGGLRKPGDWGAFGRDQADTLANLWLALRYGVRPLVSSVDDTLKQLQKQLETGKSQRTTTRTAGTLARNTYEVLTHYDGTYTNYISRKVNETHHVRAMSLDEMTWTLPMKLGLGSKDLITLPWELIPFSFVADWFVNVGDYLGAVSQAFYPKSLGQCYTIESIRSEYRQTLYQTWPANYTITSQRLGWVREDTVWKTRIPCLLAPSLVVKADFRLDDLTRLADSFALIGQQITRTFSRRS